MILLVSAGLFFGLIIWFHFKPITNNWLDRHIQTIIVACIFVLSISIVTAFLTGNILAVALTSIFSALLIHLMDLLPPNTIKD